VGSYVFQIEPPDGGASVPDLSGVPQTFAADGAAAAMREAERRLSKLPPGVCAKLFDEAGMLVWSDVAGSSAIGG
jgi:hypothetical protein